MRLRWLRYAPGSTADRHPAAIPSVYESIANGGAPLTAVVLQVWVPGWGLEKLDGEHGHWEDVPIEWQ